MKRTIQTTTQNQTANAYGAFNENGTAFIINRPDTPMPWVNIMSNGDYGTVVSQAGSGFSWRTHASLNRLTRWQQDLICDDWGKYIYIRDAESGEYWSPTYQPCGRELDHFEVEHAIGYSTFYGQTQGIKSALTVFVPQAVPCELWILKLENAGDKARELELFSYFEWALGAPDPHREFHRIFIETGYDEANQLLTASKVLWEIPGTHWNRNWEYMGFHGCSLMPVATDGDKRGFVGRHGSLRQPRAMATGELTNTHGRYGDAIGNLKTALTLAPGESTEVVFILGMADDIEQAKRLKDDLCNVKAAHAALDEAKAHWNHLTGFLKLETPDEAVNIMGRWLPYQAISARIWGRTGYFQSGGAYGYRDQLQDSLVWLLLGQPERTLAQIRLHAEHQFQAGHVLHWWHPLAEQGLESHYSDDLLWLPFLVMYYISATGNHTCLHEVLRFYDTGEATLYDHCLRAIRLVISRRSERGLPLMLEADWNDGMNMVGAEGKGESIWMGHFLTYVLKGWLIASLFHDDVIFEFEETLRNMKEALEKHAWDGAWFIRATTDKGNVLGTKDAQEGKIFLNAQTWAVLSESTTPEMYLQAFASAREYLYQDYGALLFCPAYRTVQEDVGYLTRYAPGIRENGGVYVHAACWAVLAERKVHGSDAAFKLWQQFCPVTLSAKDADRYQVEPYVMPGNISGPESHMPGQGGWSWYTGSSQWYLRALIEGVLGIVAGSDGLQIGTELPSAWNQACIQILYRGATYEIKWQRDADTIEPIIKLDGETIQSKTRLISETGGLHKVEVILPMRD